MRPASRLSVLTMFVLLSACGGSPSGPSIIGTGPDGFPIRNDEFTNEEAARAEAACDGVTEISEDQCFGLTYLYVTANGDDWRNKNGWLQTKTPCSWFGVTCEGPRVVRLELPFNGLAGRLPSPLSGLGGLERLRLPANRLTDSIPAELGRLRNLRILSLRANQLTGPIPSQLGMLQNLGVLNLGTNLLTGPIPPELGNLARLTFLLLEESQLAGPVPVPVAALGGQIQSRAAPDQCRFDSNPGLSMPDSREYMDADLDDDGFICGVELRLPS